MSAEQQTITNDTIMMGVVCKKCKKTLPDHTVKTHLEDPTNSIFKCPSHKPKREGFKWGHELREWKCAHAELKKKYEDLVSKTLEENEGFLGEVRKSGYKDGHSDGYMEAREEIENLKKAHIKMAEEFDETYQEGTLALRLEIENLKTELAGDDARMDKMEQDRIQQVQKLRAEIEEVRKDAYKDGRRNGYMERATEYEKKLKELARK
jgi:flagellar biosynthesis/type III secretory pathway protein FliH